MATLNRGLLSVAAVAVLLCLALGPAGCHARCDSTYTRGETTVPPLPEPPVSFNWGDNSTEALCSTAFRNSSCPSAYPNECGCIDRGTAMNFRAVPFDNPSNWTQAACCCKAIQAPRCAANWPPELFIWYNAGPRNGGKASCSSDFNRAPCPPTEPYECGCDAVSDKMFVNDTLLDRNVGCCCANQTVNPPPPPKKGSATAASRSAVTTTLLAGAAGALLLLLLAA